MLLLLQRGQHIGKLAGQQLLLSQLILILEQVDLQQHLLTQMLIEDGMQL